MPKVAQMAEHAEASVLRLVEHPDVVGEVVGSNPTRGPKYP